MPETRLTVREMCEKFGVTPRTLRYYEYIELLAPERDGRRRLFGPREIARLTLILRGRRFGFPLEEIRRWLALYDTEGPRAQRAAWLGRAEARLAELERERAELDARIGELRALCEESRRDPGRDAEGAEE